MWLVGFVVCVLSSLEAIKKLCRLQRQLLVLVCGCLLAFLCLTIILITGDNGLIEPTHVLVKVT